jgi:hypothetical protein
METNFNENEYLNITDDSSSNDGEGRNITQERTERKRRELTNIVLDDEMKEFIIKESKTAQDIHHQFYLSKQTSYEIYHIPLKKFMMEKYNKKPTQTDNFGFVLALSYPPRMISNFNSVSDFKLSFNNEGEDSDFKPIGYEVRDYGLETCICNESLMYIHTFQNIHSGINFNIGSVCNKHYGLISKNDPDYKSNEQKFKEHKEKERERKEGLPEGFYENERQLKKEEKLKLKLKKQQEKELKKLNKKEPGCFIIKQCILCNKEGIHKIHEIGICSTCVPNVIKMNKINLNIYIKKNSAYNDCKSCDKEFVNIKNQRDLCINCEHNWCLEKCKLCPEKFLKQKTVNDLYCLDCDEKLIKCKDCDTNILKPIERCYKCEYKSKNNLDSIICKYCQQEVYVKKGEKWKKNCTDCYKKLIVTKKCIVSDCDNMIKVMPDEKWKTKCRDCC